MSSRNPGEITRIEDAALTLAAQAGDVASLGLLLERHRAGMRAVAVSVLGPGPDVDDVVQDAALTALRRVGDVRDPEAVGAWLRMIVRNHARSLLRGTVDLRPLDDLHVPVTESGPERWLERHALRDWIWEAVEELSPTLRLPLVLRHFSVGVTSYEQIAEACGVPVGTVRSRLSQGRAKLALALAATADAPHGDVGLAAPGPAGSRRARRCTRPRAGTSGSCSPSAGRPRPRWCRGTNRWAAEACWCAGWSAIWRQAYGSISRTPWPGGRSSSGRWTSATPTTTPTTARPPWPG